jgi:hypothetical protein
MGSAPVSISGRVRREAPRSAILVAVTCVDPKPLQTMIQLVWTERAFPREAL